jgi:hypothetical protein
MEPGLYDCFGRAICPKMFSSAGPVSLMIGAERSKAGPADDLSRRPAALGKAATVRALSPVRVAVATVMCTTRAHVPSCPRLR